MERDKPDALLADGHLHGKVSREASRQSSGYRMLEEANSHPVIGWIGVQDLPHAKVGRLPAGVPSRESSTNRLKAGKQMTAGKVLAGAPADGNV